jgi:hypothetical protein
MNTRLVVDFQGDIGGKGWESNDHGNMGSWRCLSPLKWLLQLLWTTLQQEKRCWMSTMALSPLQNLHQCLLQSGAFFAFGLINVAFVVMSKKLRIGTSREKDASLAPWGQI